jgi:hypothetical protein
MHTPPDTIAKQNKPYFLGAAINRAIQKMGVF